MVIAFAKRICTEMIFVKLPTVAHGCYITLEIKMYVVSHMFRECRKIISVLQELQQCLIFK